ncbi:hypothetical protein N665_3080s0002 [Sinapis alba]|nr:hypothetical protein N665_3080s0002 [Sinapis alba]
MMRARVHFGHGTRKWNPRMAPHISPKRRGIHIINMTRIARFLSEACDYVIMLINWSTTVKRLYKFRDLINEQKTEGFNRLPKRDAAGIPTISLIDTNCNPDLADISIPANDDAIASIRFILNKLVFKICEGHSSYIKNS